MWCYLCTGYMYHHSKSKLPGWTAGCGAIHAQATCIIILSPNSLGGQLDVVLSVHRLHVSSFSVQTPWVDSWMWCYPCTGYMYHHSKSKLPRWTAGCGAICAQATCIIILGPNPRGGQLDVVLSMHRLHVSSF